MSLILVHHISVPYVFDISLFKKSFEMLRYRCIVYVVRGSVLRCVKHSSLCCRSVCVCVVESCFVLLKMSSDKFSIATTPGTSGEGTT